MKKFPYRRCRALMTHVAFYLVFLFVCTSVSAQQKEWIREGQKAFDAGDLTKAIEYFKGANDFGATEEGLLALGKCYRVMFDYPQAEKTYAQLIGLPGIDPMGYFYYAQTLLANGKRAEAYQWFEKYMLLPAEETGIENRQAFRRMITHVRPESEEIQIRKMPFNSSEYDFSPAWYPGGVIFCSTRPQGKKGNRFQQTQANGVDLFLAEKDAKGRWSTAQPVKGLNSEHNEGPLMIDEKRGMMYLTRNNPNASSRTLSQDVENELFIYQAKMNRGGWGVFSKIPINMQGYSVGHPALSPDGLFLFFTSDVPGGKGGKDL
ncbi:MAG: tetratricopeptide repeat protein, partial [Bacteroidota bacterium]